MTSTDNSDVLVYLKLFEAATTPAMREARMWILSEFHADDYDSFLRQCPTGSAEWRRFTDICNLMELFGVLLKHHRLDEDLFFDLFGGIDVLWQAVCGVIVGMRKATDPRLYENFEYLYQRLQRWQQERLGRASDA